MTTTAFFDLDYTLLDISSGFTYIKESLRQRRAPVWVIGYIGLAYKFRSLDFGQAHGKLIRYVARHGRREATPFFDNLVNNKILPHITAASRDRIAWHKTQGHRVVIISASIEEMVKPVANHLKLGDDHLCTHLSVQGDKYTGELDGPLCYGPGKIEWAKRWAAKNGLDFPQTVGYFYSDSSSDVPLMELADHPIAVNPSKKLARIAKHRGWPIEKFY